MSELLAMARPCAECPWRRDVPVGKFPPERFAQLARSVEEGFNPLFACHMTPDGAERACASYLARDGRRNFTLRLLVRRHQIDWRAIVAEAENFDLFDSYQEMAEANGCRLSATAGRG
jgi:hypothetical protein